MNIENTKDLAHRCEEGYTKQSRENKKQKLVTGIEWMRLYYYKITHPTEKLGYL
jgi:hypothetical protein